MFEASHHHLVIAAVLLLLLRCSGCCWWTAIGAGARLAAQERVWQLHERERGRRREKGMTCGSTYQVHSR